MTSGRTLSDLEKEYIDEHVQDGPSHIAYQLGRLFPHENGGHRGPRTVQGYIYRNKKLPGVSITFKIPLWVMIAAAKEGISRDDLIMVAEQAVRERVAQS